MPSAHATIDIVTIAAHDQSGIDGRAAPCSLKTSVAPERLQQILAQRNDAAHPVCPVRADLVTQTVSSLERLVHDADAVGENLSQANLNAMTLEDIPFRHVTANQLNARHANLTQGRWSDSSLVGADMAHADVTESSFTGTNVADVNWTGAALNNVTGIRYAQAGWSEQDGYGSTITAVITHGQAQFSVGDRVYSRAEILREAECEPYLGRQKRIATIHYLCDQLGVGTPTTRPALPPIAAHPAEARPTLYAVSPLSRIRPHLYAERDHISDVPLIFPNGYLKPTIAKHEKLVFMAGHLFSEEQALHMVTHAPSGEAMCAIVERAWGPGLPWEARNEHPALKAADTRTNVRR